MAMLGDPLNEIPGKISEEQALRELIISGLKALPTSAFSQPSMVPPIAPEWNPWSIRVQAAPIGVLPLEDGEIMAQTKNNAIAPSADPPSFKASAKANNGDLRWNNTSPAPSPQLRLRKDSAPDFGNRQYNSPAKNMSAKYATAEFDKDRIIELETENLQFELRAAVLRTTEDRLKKTVSNLNAEVAALKRELADARFEASQELRRRETETLRIDERLQMNIRDRLVQLMVSSNQILELRTDPGNNIMAEKDGKLKKGILPDSANALSDLVAETHRDYNQSSDRHDLPISYSPQKDIRSPPVSHSETQRTAFSTFGPPATGPRAQPDSAFATAAINHHNFSHPSEKVSIEHQANASSNFHVSESRCTPSIESPSSPLSPVVSFAPPCDLDLPPFETYDAGEDHMEVSDVIDVNLNSFADFGVYNTDICSAFNSHVCKNTIVTCLQSHRCLFCRTIAHSFTDCPLKTHFCPQFNKAWCQSKYCPKLHRCLVCHNLHNPRICVFNALQKADETLGKSVCLAWNSGSGCIGNCKKDHICLTCFSLQHPSVRCPDSTAAYKLNHPQRTAELHTARSAMEDTSHRFKRTPKKAYVPIASTLGSRDNLEKLTRSNRRGQEKARPAPYPPQSPVARDQGRDWESYSQPYGRSWDYYPRSNEQ